jgi:hypothetical protein
MNLAAGDVRNFQVQEINEAAQDATLGLASQPEKDEIVARQNRVGNLRQNGFLVSVNAGEEWLSGVKLLQKVSAEFFLDCAACFSGYVARKLPQFAERCGFCGHWVPLIRFTVPLYATPQIAAEFIDN